MADYCVAETSSPYRYPFEREIGVGQRVSCETPCRIRCATVRGGLMPYASRVQCNGLAYSLLGFRGA